MRSYDAIEDPTPRSVLQLLSFKATHRAKYFWAGMLDIAKYNHYALNAPLYTHFTTPIRRYADIILIRIMSTTSIRTLFRFIGPIAMLSAGWQKTATTSI
jgi:protein SSD1